jgi:hypothetical protein
MLEKLEKREYSQKTEVIQILARKNGHASQFMNLTI